MKQFIICPDCGSIELAQIESRVPARWDFYRCTKCKQLIPGDERWLAKAISIKQPWAYLIAYGIKDIENRTWKTNFRGRVLIHVGAKKIDYNPVRIHFSMTIHDYKLLHRSAIIGSVEIVDCIQNSQSGWADPDCWHWVLKDPVLFEKPILNVKGKLSFFIPQLP